MNIRDIEAVLNILCVESLNVPAKDEEGQDCEFQDLLGNDHEVRFNRLKSLLLSTCTNSTQEQVVELLSDQYDVEEISEKLNCTREHIRRIIREIRLQCLKLKNSR